MFRKSMAAVIAAGLASLAASAARADCSLQTYADLKIAFVDDQAFIDTRINGTGARFMIDSGDFFNVLSQDAATRLGLKLYAAPAYYWVRGIGGYGRIAATTVKAFTIAGLTINDVIFFVDQSDRPAPTAKTEPAKASANKSPAARLEKVGDGAVGLIGQNFLGVGDVEYDLAHGAIRLYRPAGCEQTPMAYWAGPKTPFSVMRIEPRDDEAPFTIGDVYVNGVRLRALFDTGAQRSLITRAAAARLGLRTDGLGVVRAGRIQGVGPRLVDTWIAPVASFKIGGEEIRNTHMRIADTVADEVDTDVILGADFFAAHRIYVANGQRKLYLSYNGGPLFNLDTSSAKEPKAPAKP